MKYKILLLAIIFSSLFAASQDSLVLFTKSACSYCTQAKSIFKTKGITWNEYDLKVNGNREIMLNVFRKHDYHGTIYLPVIVFNDSILYPVKISQTQMSRGNLDSTISFIDKNWKGERKYLPIDSTYLICKVLNDESSAKSFLKGIDTSEFPNADILNHNNKFYVYLEVYAIRKDAFKKLQQIKNKYSLAHLLQPTKKQ